MPVKHKKPKKEGKKFHKEKISSQVVDEQNLKVKEIESEIQKNVEIITEEIEKPVKKEVHVFVKKELPMEDSKKEEKIEKNNGTMSQQEITQKLTEIYEDADGDMPDMQQFQKSKHSSFLHAFFILIFSVIFFATIAWIGFFVVQPGVKFSEDNIILTMSGNDNFISGEKSTYRIRYKNSQDVALHNVVLEVRYPKGFKFTSSTKETINDNNDSWKIGDIEAQGSGYIDVTGNIYGDINSEQSFRVFLNYMPDNFSSDFQKITTLTLSNKDSLVKVEIQTAEQVVAGLDTPIKIIISPNSDVPVKNVLVSCVGGSFALKSSEPKSADGKSCEWYFESLDASKEINLSGFFSEDKENTNKFQVIVKNWDSPERIGNGYILFDTQKEVALSNLETLYNLVVNGTTGSFDIQPGDTINATVSIKNNGDSVLKDAKLKVIIDAPSSDSRSILSWDKLDTGEFDSDIVGQQLSSDVRRGTITFDKRYISELKEIMPGDEIKVNVILPIKTSDNIRLSDYVAYRINVKSELSYNLNDKTELISSNQVDIKLTSDLKMATQDEISQDVGGNDVHQISWVLTNTYHDLKNIEVTADLYGDISVDESNIVVPAGTITYDKDKKKLIWKIEQMPISVDVLAVQFDVTILSENPTQKNLTSKPVVTAFDNIIQQDLKIFGQELILVNS